MTETDQFAELLAVLEEAVGAEMTVVKITADEITVMATLPGASMKS
jgi:hypothetical protein